MTPILRGLYVLTPNAAAGADAALPDLVDLAIRGGARLVQYRNKGSDQGQRRDEASALLTLCRRAGLALVINDDVDLALSVSADGVHLGRDDADPTAARRRLGAGAIIGVSCYDRLDLAETAARAGASYVAFGSFFPSPTKPDATRASPELLRAARRILALPLVAIGGITPQNAAAVIDAGADMVAVITGVFSATDVEAAARAYSALFTTGPRA